MLSREHENSSEQFPRAQRRREHLPIAETWGHPKGDIFAAADPYCYSNRAPTDHPPLFPGWSAHDKTRRPFFAPLPHLSCDAHVRAHNHLARPGPSPLTLRLRALSTPYTMDQQSLDAVLASIQVVGTTIQTIFRVLYHIQYSFSYALGFVFPPEPTELDQVSDYVVPFLQYARTLYDALPGDTAAIDFNTIPELLTILWPVVAAMLVAVRLSSIAQRLDC